MIDAILAFTIGACIAVCLIKFCKFIAVIYRIGVLKKEVEQLKKLNDSILSVDVEFFDHSFTVYNIENGKFLVQCKTHDELMDYLYDKHYGKKFLIDKKKFEIIKEYK